MPLGRICSRRGGAICTACPGSCRIDDRRRNAKSKAHGLTLRRWQRLRQATLDRDGRRCRFRLPGCTKVATSVHLHPELQGDHTRASLDDCTSSCAHCHGVVDALRKPS
jgi:hypothetical protein